MLFRSEDLDAQIERNIETLTVLPELRDLVGEILRSNHGQQVETTSNIYETQHKTLVSLEAQLEKLLDKNLCGDIPDDEYKAKRNKLVSQISLLEEEISRTRQKAKDEREKTEQTFDFASRAHNAFLNGDIQTKKEILLGLGLNFTLKDGKLNILQCPWLIPIKNEYKAVEEKYRRLEPSETSIYTSEKEKERVLASLNPELYPQPDLNRCYRRERAVS